MEPTPTTPPKPAGLTPSFTADGRVLFPCFSCAKKLSVKPTNIGKSITCPHCKTSNTVPDPAAAALTQAESAPVVTTLPEDSAPASTAIGGLSMPSLPDLDDPIEPTRSAQPTVSVPARDLSALIEPAPALNPVSDPVNNTTINPAGNPVSATGGAVTPVKPRASRSADGRILFPCGSCAKKLSVKPTNIGKAITCPHCKTSNVVPDPDAALAESAGTSAVPAPVSSVEPAQTVVMATPEPLAEPVLPPHSPSIVTFEAVATTPGEVTMAPAPAVEAVTPPAATVQAVSAAVQTVAAAVPEVVIPASAPVVEAVVPPTAPVQAVSAAVQTVAAAVPEVVIPASAPAAEAAATAPAAAGPGHVESVKHDPSERFIFGCYFCGKKMSVKARSIGRSLRCPTCRNENIVPSPEQAADRVVPTPDQWKSASINMAVGAQVEVRLFFPCFSCHKKISAKIDQAGQPMRCPGCQTINAVPALAIAPIALDDMSNEARSSSASTSSSSGPSNASSSVSSNVHDESISAVSAVGPAQVTPVSTSASVSSAGGHDVTGGGVAVPAAAEPSITLGGDVNAVPVAGEPEHAPRPDPAPVADQVTFKAGSQPEHRPAAVKPAAALKPEVLSEPVQPAAIKSPAKAGPGFERGLEHLNRAQALAALSQIIPSAASKAAEIVDDSTVLPPVKTPGLRSEIALRHYSSSGKSERRKSDHQSLDSSPAEPSSETLPIVPPIVSQPVGADDIAQALGALSGPAESIPAFQPAPEPAPLPVKDLASDLPGREQVSPAADAGPSSPADKPKSKLAAGFIAFWCTGCQKRLTVKSKHAGATMPCPVCKTMNLVPAVTPPGVLDGPQRVAAVPAAPAAVAPEPPVKPASLDSELQVSLEPDSPVPAQQHKAKSAPAAAPKPVPAPAKAVEPAKPKPAAKPPASQPPKPAKPVQQDHDDPFAALAATAAQQQGGGHDMSDALAALAGGVGSPTGPGLDDLASALGAINQLQGDADADDITTALAHQPNQPDDGLVVTPAEEAPIQLMQDVAAGNKPKQPPKPQVAKAKPPVSGAGKFIPTDKNDGQLRFPCTQCGHRLKVPPQARGKKAKCPACATINKVPD